LVLDPRAAGLAICAIAIARRRPPVVVLLVAATVTALLRAG
jgi:hypothetical protein